MDSNNHIYRQCIDNFVYVLNIGVIEGDIKWKDVML